MKNEKLHPVKTILVVLTGLFVLLMVYTFMPSSEDEYLYFSSDIISNPNTHLSLEDFKRIRKGITLAEARVDVRGFDYPALEDISFHPNTSEVSEALNTRAYQISARYYNPDLMTNINPDYVDPLFIMALGNVEWPSITDHKVLWSPSLPIKFLEEEQWTVEYMDNITLAVFLESESLWNNVFDSYMGALQLSVEYGAWVPIIDELESTEKARILQALDGAPAPSYVANKLHLFEVSNADLETGDRFNWRDATNRTAGHFNHIMGKYLEKDSIEKAGEYAIDNKFSLMALLSMGHNTGEAAVYSSDEYIVNVSWWIFGPAKFARKYAHDLGDERIISFLSNEARNAVSVWRNGGGFKAYLGRGEAIEWLNEWNDQGWIDTDYLDTSVNQYEEKAGYPIQTLYNYFVLRELYGGE